MRRVIVSLLSVAAVLTGQSTIRDIPSFSTTTRLVEINVIATGPDGPVTDLTKDDFTLLEDGHEQQIAFFGVNARTATPETPPAEGAQPGFSNRPPGEGSPGGAVFVVFDMMGTNSFADEVRAKQAIVKALEGLRPDDQVGIYILRTGGLTILQDFNSDSSRLVAALKEHAKWPDLPALLHAVAVRDDARNRGLVDQDLEEHPSTGSPLERYESRRRVVRQIADHLSRVRGRKSVIWVSNSGPGDAFLADDAVAVYPIEPRGLVSYSGFQAEFRTVRFRPFHNYQASRQREIAKLTGGVALVNNNGIHGAISRAVRDGDHSYTLSYYSSPPANAQEANRLRQIEVKVRRKGVQLRYRRAYRFGLEDPEEPDRALNFAAWTGLDSSRIGIHGQLDDTPEGIELAAAINTSELSLMRDDGHWHGDLRFLAVQRDAEGRELARAGRQSTLDADQDGYQRLLDRGVTVSVLLGPDEPTAAPPNQTTDLPVHIWMEPQPGLANLKLMVYDDHSNQIGSLTVPVSQ